MSRRHLLISLLCLGWIVPGLIGHDPWKTDDAYTFGVIYDMLRGGSWLVPTLAGEVFLDEPPLYYLSAVVTATLASPLLPLHDGARLATGVYMGLTLLFCGMAGRELHGKGNGAIAGLLLMGCFGLVLRGHETITDVAPLAGFALAYYALALALRRERLAGVLLGGALGMVFLSQGVLETLIVMLIAAALPLLSPAWRAHRYAQTLLLAGLIATPLIVAWPLALHLREPALLDTWLQNDCYALFNMSGRDVTFYLRILPWHAWPAWMLCAWTLWNARREQYATPAIALPLTGFVVTLLLLSAAGTARDLYALTLLPALALLGAPAARNLRRGAANAWLWFSVTGVTFFIIVAWFYWTGLELGAPARLHAHLHRLQPGYAPGFKWLPFTLAACYTVAWFVLLAKLKRSPEKPAVVWAAGIAVLWGLTATLFIGWVDTGKSYRAVFTGLQQNLPAKYHCVSSRNLGESQRAMLHYYADVITHRDEVASRRRECDLLLIQGVLREDTPPGNWRKIWEGKRPGDKVERYRLYQRIERTP
jgi:4-amino-4-deoxy-L-arabinose transferase-like glycosyltransferase